MKLVGKVFLLLTFIVVSAQTLSAQTPNNNSSVKIEIKNYKYIVSGAVSSEAVKNEIVGKISEMSKNNAEFSGLKVVSTVEPFTDGWQKGFEKALFKSKLWKSGVFIFTTARNAKDYPNVPDGILNAKIFPIDGGAPFRIADYGNKTVVLFFLASWCAPCLQQADTLQEFYAKASASGVEIIGVNSDTDEDEKFKEFIARRKYGYKMATADKNLYEAAFKISKFPGFPQAFLIRDGKLYAIFTGNAPTVVEKLREVTLEVSKMR
ncbi:MAG TPA: TlpA disulfide reductase family protein [Pyrinomonadaceae bacterium]|jgi:thiol-disulfide isomerase/thioredoxin